MTEEKKEQSTKSKIDTKLKLTSIEYDINGKTLSILPFFSVGIIDEILIWNKDVNVSDRIFCENVITNRLEDPKFNKELIKELSDIKSLDVLDFFITHIIEEKIDVLEGEIDCFKVFKEQMTLKSFRLAAVAYAKASQKQMNISYNKIFNNHSNLYKSIIPNHMSSFLKTTNPLSGLCKFPTSLNSPLPSFLKTTSPIAKIGKLPSNMQLNPTSIIDHQQLGEMFLLMIL